jgi:hypothetical protein
VNLLISYLNFCLILFRFNFSPIKLWTNLIA